MSRFTAFCAITLSAMVIATFGPEIFAKAASKNVTPVPASVNLEVNKGVTPTKAEVAPKAGYVFQVLTAQKESAGKSNVIINNNSVDGKLKSLYGDKIIEPIPSPKGHIEIESPKPEEAPTKFNPDSTWVIPC